MVRWAVIHMQCSDAVAANLEQVIINAKSLAVQDIGPDTTQVLFKKIAAGSIQHWCQIYLNVW
jgi:hypothetical protein